MRAGSLRDLACCVIFEDEASGRRFLRDAIGLIIRRNSIPRAYARGSPLTAIQLVVFATRPLAAFAPAIMQKT